MLDGGLPVCGPVMGAKGKVLFQQLDNRGIGRRRTVGDTATVKPGALGTGEALAECVQQAGLAQSRLANDRDGLAASRRSELRALPQEGQLALPPDQAR